MFEVIVEKSSVSCGCEFHPLETAVYMCLSDS